jgi:hypothetical protein
LFLHNNQLRKDIGVKNKKIKTIFSKVELKLFTHRGTPGDHKWLGDSRKQQPRQQPDRKRIPCSSGYQRRDRVGTLKNNCTFRVDSFENNTNIVIVIGLKF